MKLVTQMMFFHAAQMVAADGALVLEGSNKTTAMRSLFASSPIGFAALLCVWEMF